MRFRQNGWTKSLFILVSLGVTGATVVDCGGDDTGNTTGTGGSAGTGGTSGSGGGGTDGPVGGAGGTADAGRDASDSSLGGGGTGGTNGTTDARVVDAPSEAAIAACNSTLSDAGVTPCLSACFCAQCTTAATACLGNPDCLAIAQCALDTLCFVDGVAACLTANTCGPTVAAHQNGLAPALAFAPNACVPACVTQCTPDTGAPGSDAAEASFPDATPSTDATDAPPASDARVAPADSAAAPDADGEAAAD